MIEYEEMDKKRERLYEVLRDSDNEVSDIKEYESYTDDDFYLKTVA